MTYAVGKKPHDWRDCVDKKPVGIGGRTAQRPARILCGPHKGNQFGGKATLLCSVRVRQMAQHGDCAMRCGNDVGLGAVVEFQSLAFPPLQWYFSAFGPVSPALLRRVHVFLPRPQWSTTDASASGSFTAAVVAAARRRGVSTIACFFGGVHMASQAIRPLLECGTEVAYLRRCRGPCLCNPFLSHVNLVTPGLLAVGPDKLLKGGGHRTANKTNSFVSSSSSSSSSNYSSTTSPAVLNVFKCRYLSNLSFLVPAI